MGVYCDNARKLSRGSSFRDMSVKFRHRELGIRALNEVVAGLEAPSSRSRTLVSGVLVERSSVKDLRV